MRGGVLTFRYGSEKMAFWFKVKAQTYSNVSGFFFLNPETLGELVVRRWNFGKLLGGSGRLGMARYDGKGMFQSDSAICRLSL